MTEGRTLADGLATLDSLSVAVLTDDVSDNYVSKTPFAVSEFANVVREGASVISGEALLCANLGFGLRLVSSVGEQRHTLLFDTGPEGPIFLRNCKALGIRLGEVEAIAVTHGHWDHMAALPTTIDQIIEQGGRVTVHVNPGMFNERAVRLGSGKLVPVANDSRQQRGGTSAARQPLLLQRADTAGHTLREGPRRSLLSKEPRRLLGARPPVAGRAHARGEGPRPGSDRVQHLLPLGNRQRVHARQDRLPEHSHPHRDGRIAPRRCHGTQYPRHGGWVEVVQHRSYHHRALHRLACLARSGRHSWRCGQPVRSRYDLHLLVRCAVRHYDTSSNAAAALSSSASSRRRPMICS
ncbi:MAG: hypothetical protein DMD87_15880 [Candidatus Rokuibacteriota bacterium]|nr:MAG: hypothetical protein DMD87_15880 [Candidatus Rokubacteria bacterium]